MKYRTWTHAGTALLLAVTPNLSVFAQGAGSTRPTSQAVPVPANVSAPIVPVLDTAAQSALQKAISNSQRIEPSRDRWRNPGATLQFFGVRPTDTVIEVWPGQGWYTSILGPYLKQGGGSLVVGHFDAASTNSSVVRQIVDAYRARFASNQGTYGSVSVVPFGPRSGALGAPGSADSVLTFRNIHNWMAQGWAEKAFGDFFLVLKPGGILGIEEHRGRTDEPQDPLARDGYVREDFVIQLAREAGFDFIGRSEINANPADTKDHPFGVWTLPPVSRTSALGQRDDPGFDRIRYNAIGESDRMTLRFRKPLSATGAPPAAGTRWAPVIVAPAPPPPAPRPTPPVVRVVRPPVVTAPVVVAPVVASPVVVPPAGGPAIVTARPSPPAPTLSPVAPPIGPSVGSSPPRNSEAAAPRAVEPAPKPKPTIVSPAPVVPLPVSPPPVSPPPVSPPPVAPAPILSPPPIVPPSVVDPTIIAKPLEPIKVPVVSQPPPIIAPDPSPPVLPIPNKPDPVVPDIVDPSIKVTVTPDPIAAPASPPVLTPPPRPTPVQPSSPKPVTALPNPPPPVRALPRPATRPTIAQPVRPTVARPAPPSTPAPKPAPAAARPAPRPKAAPPVVAPASSPAASRPAAPRPAAARPAVARPAVAPLPKAKAKAPPPPPARPVTRPAPPPPVAKKKATPPPVDPNKPDWVVPRRRS